MASGKSFKEIYGVSSTFTGGYMPPEDIMIVGVDIPLEDWNADLWDEARLKYAQEHPIPPEDMIRLGGVKDPVAVTKRQGQVLAAEGRRRILAARAANRILKSRGVLPEEWIEVPIYVDKSQDLEISVRLGNEGRLEDPPWIKAQNAARLRERGKGDEVIRAVMGGIDAATLRQWFAYLDASPKIRNHAEGKVLPFSVAAELGKLGKGQEHLQELALECLYSTGAKLTGEDGRTNTRAMVKAIKDGTVKSLSDVAPPIPPRYPPVPPDLVARGFDDPREPAPPEPFDVTRSEAHDKAPAPAAPAPTPERGPGGGKGHTHGNGKAPALTVRRLSPRAISLITAALEPAAKPDFTGDSDEEARVALAIMRVVSGQDPTGEGLSPWPRISMAFTQFIRSAPKEGA